MKTFVFNILLVAGFVQMAESQVNLPIDAASGKITYDAVINARTATQAGLYKSSLDWFALHYDSRNAVVKVNDPAQGQFSFEGNFTDSTRLVVQKGADYAMLPTLICYNLNIEMGPGKCSIRLSNLCYSYYVPGASIVNPSDKGAAVENTFEAKYHNVIASANDAPERKAWMDFFSSCDKRLNAIISSYKKHITEATSGGNDGF